MASEIDAAAERLVAFGGSDWDAAEYMDSQQLHTDMEAAGKWILARLAADRAEREERSAMLCDLLQVFKCADDERLKEVRERDAEAEKWKSEGDMYGWNFHKGMASGCTSASIIFFRVRRAIEKQLDLLRILKGGA